MGLEAITPERVRAAYLERGWKPVRHQYGCDAEMCGCGLGVLIGFQTWVDLLASTRGQIARKLGIAFNEIQGFAHGFDGDACLAGSKEAYLLGRACWEAVKDLAVKEVGA